MLSPELELADLDARHWRNGWRLLVPPRVLDRPRWVLVIVDRDPAHVLKVIVAGPGAPGSIDPAHAPLPGVAPDQLAAYANQLGASAVVVADRRLLAAVSRELEGTAPPFGGAAGRAQVPTGDRTAPPFGGAAGRAQVPTGEGALRADQDGVAQALAALRVLKHHSGVSLWTEPSLLDLLPAPAVEPLQRTFDLLVPDRSALAAYVIEDDRTRVHTSLIAVKEGGVITRAATHRAIGDLVSEETLARDWERGYKRVLTALEERFARPSIALFLERATLLKVLTGPSDQLARELNARRVVIDPAPAWLLGLLGGAAMAAVAGRAAKGLAQMLPQAARERASAFAQRARDAIDPFALLGFDPIELWQRLKHHYRP